MSRGTDKGGSDKPPGPTWIYHITDIANLARIEQCGAMACMKTLRAEAIDFASSAFESVQGHRATKVVPAGPGGCLHDYVPFYFAPRSPMLYTINRGNVPRCPHGQRDIVYSVTTAERVRDGGLGFVFTDGHGIMAVTRFYDDLDSLDQVDWPIMAARYWQDTNEDGDRRRRRQAEFLVHRSLPLNLLIGIGVRTHSQIEIVKAAMPSCTDVQLKPGWYY
jgi:hypothetical protein